MKNINKDLYKFDRLMYIIEAALEYFISISVSTVYLARITSYIGLSDVLTGILSSFVSLGCGFQLFAIFLANKHPAKPFVTAGHIISQLLFCTLYFVPLMNIGIIGRTVLFTVILLAGQIIHNIINSHKINWFMSLVEDDKRGRFTANKEMVSLIGGVAFSYLLGFVMDYYTAKGNTEKAFIACGIGIFVLMILHSLTLILSKEKEINAEPVAIKDNLKEILKNKTLFKIIAISVLWNVANYATISFTGTYQIKELAFSATFSSVIIMVGSLMRAAASRPMGIFADKTSFCKMLSVCFVIEAAAFGINIFTAPQNGKILYFIFYILYAIGMAGINSATINLIYDYVDYNNRTSALALQQTFAGFSGFFTTILLSPFVSYIQDKKLPFYAQQAMSLISFCVILITIVYINTVIRSLKSVSQKNNKPISE